MSDFVHLHVHTQYSLLDGFSHIPKLMERVKELGMNSVGITDHGTMFGVIEFFNQAQKYDIKPIYGIETYLAARKMTDKESVYDRKSSHLILLAKDQTGYKNLLKIASASQLEGFYYKPRIDHDFLAEHSEGLIATTACLSGEVPRAILRDNPDEAKRMLEWYFEVFGRDNFYIELQQHPIPELPEVNRQLIEMGKHFNARFLATNDVHYIKQEEARYQDIMLCVQTGSLLTDPNRMRMPDDSYYLRSPEEMSALFTEIPEAITNTVLVAEQCNVDLSTDGYILPEYDIPEGHTNKSYLRELCLQGLEKRYGPEANSKVVMDRLNMELEIIDEMGFNTYFLIVWDLCIYSQKNGIWYNARGSAAGSIVAYSLEITLVDPLAHGLIFERFLNPGRVTMPDIDLDFQDDKRHMLMEYCAHKYGEDKVASIITFGKLKAKAAVRDVGRVLDIPLSEVDKIAKMIPTIPLNMKIKEAIEKVPELKQQYNEKEYVRELLDNAIQVEGTLRNAGTHAAGVVITDKPIVDYIPLHRPTSNSEETPIKTVTQFDVNTIDQLGLLKVDFLGLSSLTIMQRCADMIKERHGKEFDLHNIPLDDEETFNQLGKGNTAGVFQLEGSGMTRWVMQMKPDQLDHVIAMVALYRPGPMEFIPSYINRMQGKEEIEYLHESLEPILGETFGITVYQEQIMYTAMKLANFSASEADFLRKAVAKKKEKQLLENYERFTNGAEANGISREAADKIFSNWEAFARYGFPKGHAADYAVLAVETAYLKTHYTVEYMTALLSVYQGNVDKIAFYVADCKNLGIEVLQPDINQSECHFSIEDGPDGEACIRFGMWAIKNVGLGPIEAIIEGRKDKKFEDLDDFSIRVDLRKVGKRALESLIMAGAFDSFGPRMAILQVMERLVMISSSHFQAKEAGQLTFFGAESDMGQRIQLPMVDPDYNRREQLNWERELIGLFITDHPLSSIYEKLKDKISHTSGQLSQVEDRQYVRVLGMVSRIRPHITKKGDPMGFAGLEDIQGMIDLVIFPRTWKKYQESIRHDQVLIVEGKIDLDSGEPKLLVDRISEDTENLSSLKDYYTKCENSKRWRNNFKKNSPPKQKPEPTPVPVDEVQKPVEINEEKQQETNQEINDQPLPPDNFPPGWDENLVDLKPDEKIAAPVREIQEEVKPAEELVIAETKTGEYIADNGNNEKEESSQNEESRVIELKQSDNVSASVEAAAVPLPSDDVNPVEIMGEVEEAKTAKSNNAPTKMITVVVRHSGDQARDNLRLRRIHGLLISYPGKDRFAFYVVEGSNGYQLEFPNDSTNISSELLKRLEQIVGAENVITEEITYQ